VGVTGECFQELHTCLGREEADRLDATRQRSTYPSLSNEGGLPEGVVIKLAEAFKKFSEGPEFQEVLNRFDLPYDYKDQAQLEKEIPPEYEMIKDYLQKIGVIK
jgi:hypothetical protein